jgi:hypothetical protein
MPAWLCSRGLPTEDPEVQPSPDGGKRRTHMRVPNAAPRAHYSTQTLARAQSTPPRLS